MTPKLNRKQKRQSTCIKCKSCGKVSDDRFEKPWSDVEKYPDAGLAIILDIMKPKTCPSCVGSGKVEGRYI